jgi:hypothetical protein
MIGIRLPLAFLPVYINIIIEAIKILSDTPIHNNELAGCVNESKVSEYSLKDGLIQALTTIPVNLNEALQNLS